MTRDPRSEEAVVLQLLEEGDTTLCLDARYEGVEADVDGNAWLPHSRSSMMAVQEERKSGSGTQNPTQQNKV
ncbi:hypothetical protein C2W62_36515, partial [Candidatus Entotheonella serta]